MFLIFTFVVFQVILLLGFNSFEEELSDCRLNGIFLQLNQDMSVWSKEQWEGKFRNLKALGFNQVIVQWCKYGEMQFFDIKDGVLESDDRAMRENVSGSVNEILRLAQKYNMEVFLGLYSESCYWKQIKAPPSVLEKYLYHITDENLRVAKQLRTLISQNKSFKGFYIPQEIDDFNWLKKKRAKILNYYLKVVTHRLKDIIPEGKLLVSTFFRGRMSPRYFAHLWLRILENAPFDGVLLQDGMGSGDVTYDMVKRYCGEMAKVCHKKKVCLWGIVEAFIRYEPGESKAFAAKSVTFQKLIKQISIMKPMTDNIVGFSFIYFDPLSGISGARRLFTDYSRYYRDNFANSGFSH